MAVTGEPDWAPENVDTRRANIARVYDYLLGGTHNFLADQDAGRALAAVEPRIREFARANRDFLGAAVRHLYGAGIRQFLDIGSGIPTAGNVHEVAAECGPGARVAYVDVDSIAVAHAGDILAGRTDTAVLQADLRAPERILASPVIRGLLDFSEPIGLLLVSVLPFVTNAENPWQVVGMLCDAMVPGSYLVICHATVEDERAGVTEALNKVYRSSVPTSGSPRGRAELARFFEGYELADPGIVNVGQWPDPARPGQRWGLAAVGRKL